MERRGREYKRSIVASNIADWGESYTEFEKLAKLGSMPPWPIRQCMATSKTTHGRCRNKIGQPGQILCRWHFGTTKRNRRIAIRRWMTWLLCGLPVEEDGLLELLLDEVLAERLSQKAFYTDLSMELQMRLLSALMEMSGILDVGDDA